MILKKVYKTSNAIKSTLIDGIDKIDEGVMPDGNKFVNVYKRGRKKDDEFETVVVDGSLTIYVENEEGKTLSIVRGDR